MTHLGNAISRLMITYPKHTAADIAKKAGFHRSYLSRLQSGQVGISPKALVKLANAITRDGRERAELVAAHMKDESCGFYPDLIQITIHGKLPGSGDLHPEIEYLQKHLSDPRLRDAVHSLVELHRGNGNKVGNTKRSSSIS